MSQDAKSTSLEVAQHYLGEKGREYFEWQCGHSHFVGTIEARKFAPYIQPTNAVLDFGCGPGTTLANLHAAVRHAVEPNPVARAFCDAHSKGAITTHASIEEVPDQCVDVVISNHCLEHVPNPTAILRQFLRVLRPGGKIVIYLPIDDWRSQRHYDSRDISHHLHTWTPLLFGHTLFEGGFSKIQVDIYRHAFHPKFEFLYRKFPIVFFDAACWLMAVCKKRRQLRAIAYRN